MFSKTFVAIFLTLFVGKNFNIWLIFNSITKTIVDNNLNDIYFFQQKELRWLKIVVLTRCTILAATLANPLATIPILIIAFTGVSKGAIAKQDLLGNI